MEEQIAASGGGMAADPISAVAGAVDSVFTFYNTAVEAVTTPMRARWENLPEWLSPADFQQEDYTLEILLGGIVIAFVVLVGVIAFIAARK
jgi:hypothetical protein